ncbi:MAG TPA: hypothetical protein PLH03_01995 [Methylophilaceae bacterium]|nr:hypothetical protein [Methylophilaceae bacterium]
MSNFDLQQWLDGQLEHNVLLESADTDDIVADENEAVDVSGFGFPHYAELNSTDISNPGANHFFLL